MGKETTSPMPAITSVNSSPPQMLVATVGKMVSSPIPRINTRDMGINASQPTDARRRSRLG